MGRLQEGRTGGVDDEHEVAAAAGGGRGGGVVGREADGAQLGAAARGPRPDQRRPWRRRRGHDVAVALSRFDCAHTHEGDARRKRRRLL